MDEDVPMESTQSKEARKASYMKQAKAEVDKYRTRLEDERWHPVTYKEGTGISAYEMEALGDGYYLKADGIVEKFAEDIARAHRDHNHISRISWDGANIHDIGLLEDISHRPVDKQGNEFWLTVNYALHKPRVPAVSMREFVYLEFAWRMPSQTVPGQDKWVILACHTDHPKRPPRKDPVRALSRTIMVLEPRQPLVSPDASDTPRTSVTIMAWVDPGGDIPAAVIKLYKTILADRIAWLRTIQFV